MADLNGKDKAVEQTTATTVVQASVEQCYAVGIDIASYPEWVEGISVAEILTTDEEERPVTARFEAEAVGRRSNYTLKYDHAGSPDELSWSLVEGDLARSIHGRYSFQPTESADADSPPQTEVRYELAIDLAVPMPGFVKRRAEDKIVTSALKEFKRRVEG